MIVYLLQNGGFENVDETWPELAERYSIGMWPTKDQNQREKNGKAAMMRWKRFLGTKRGLEFKKATIDKDGNVRFTTIGRASEPDNQNELLTKSGAEFISGTTNPYGKPWLKFHNLKAYGLDIESASKVSEHLQGKKFRERKISKGNGTGIVDFSDLHTGGVLKHALETVKTLPFDLEILTAYMDKAVSLVNSYNFKKLFVMLPGDLVETFTAFNHKDTWRHVQANQGGIVILAYELIKRTLENLNNVEKVFMVEGNHDRMTSGKEGNSRKGVVEIIAYFLAENSSLDIVYHPWLTAAEIDGCWHMMTHGDHKPFLKNDFWFRYGKQGIYNVLRTGHYHGFNILRQTNENLHYQCPSIFPGNFFSESIGFDAVPAITVCQHENGIPRVDYRPLGNIMNNECNDRSFDHEPSKSKCHGNNKGKAARNAL